MPWSNLQAEVLAEFADIRWNGAALRSTVSGRRYESGAFENGGTTELPDGLVSISVNDNWQVVARKRDDSFSERVLEIAKTKLAWSTRALAKAAGDDSHSGSIATGRVLSDAPGWVLAKRFTWANQDALMAWCLKQPCLSSTAAAAETGVPRQTLVGWLKADGWLHVKVGTTWRWLSREALKKAS